MKIMSNTIKEGWESLRKAYDFDFSKIIIQAYSNDKSKLNEVSVCGSFLHYLENECSPLFLDDFKGSLIRCLDYTQNSLNAAEKPNKYMTEEERIINLQEYTEHKIWCNRLIDWFNEINYNYNIRFTN